MSPTSNRMPTASPEQTLKSWSEAFLLGDVDRAVSFYDESEDVVLLHSTGDVSRGITEVRTDYVNAFEEVVFEDVSLDLSGSWQDGDVAWATGRFVAQARRKADDSLWRLEISTSFVLKNRGGTWKIFLEQSTPLKGIPRIRRRDQGQ